MIPQGAKVVLAARPVDFRKGPESLMALVREAGADPFSGALYVFRSKRADKVKIVWWDGSGICLYAKTLDEGGFHWPPITGGVVRMHAAQLLALVAGMDWRRVSRVPIRRPTSLG
ncbi:IS66 family insertion sequence element accessory protein TnpB [Mongoliimonas terrestris]|uniref:IS66 family insertion sequence element accessory protein TnpB n=1 Tax=Mongoliimonas terrestris TaxID=1709001 RepID=UPI0009496256|nr:IS66 family insertion sequence element accessory protein TnpB [Mongoliimonas terrestris]